MGAQLGRTPGRLRGVPQDGLLVPGALGVMGEHGPIAVAALLQRGEQAPV
jgi:hypothetical protein